MRDGVIGGARGGVGVRDGVSSGLGIVPWALSCRRRRRCYGCMGFFVRRMRRGVMVDATTLGRVDCG